MIARPMYAGIHFSDQEPWGRALTTSVTIHVLLALLLLLGVKRQETTQAVLTEIRFVELPAAAAQPEPVAGGEGKGLGRGAGSKTAKKGGSGTVIGSASSKGPIQSHPELANKGQYSSEVGTPDGDVIVAKPMSGPIVALDQFGMVGKKKGALMPYAAQTEGRPGGRGPSLPAGVDTRETNGQQIILARANLAELQRAESSLGVPLISEKVVSDAAGAGGGGGSGRLRQLSGTAIGGRRKASFESLKANPLEKDRWGKAGGPFTMEGPLKYRKILKLDLPPYPRWAEEKGIETSVSIRLWVNPGGKVKDNMYLEKTSGYAELDSLAMQYLARFIFVRLPDDQTQEDEWGVATFRFELKK